MKHRAFIIACALLWCTFDCPVYAGMPTPLPTGWTSDSQPWWARTGRDPQVDAAVPFLQAISFFVVVLFLCACVVKFLWRVLRKDFPQLPPLRFGRALAMVMLWGLLFVVVLTMISGARELMTPGAWQKQGWTYRLAESQDPAADARAERREALERLRDALWQYAATHNGRFPAEGDAAIDPDYWHIPGWPGVTFIRLKPAKAENIGRLLVMEPELDDDQRHVLLSNGFVGTMRSAEIRQALQAEMDRETQRLSHTADQQLPQQP